MTTDTTPFDFEQESRPQFLTTLCVLTFIGVGIMMLLSLISFKSSFLTSDAEKQEQREIQYEQMSKLNPEGADAMQETMLEIQKYEKPNWVTGFFCNLLTLAGALSMWKGKRLGFHLYVLGEILPYLVPIVLFGQSGLLGGGVLSSLGGVAHTFAIAAIALMVISDITFIIFYALNLKHLK